MRTLSHEEKRALVISLLLWEFGFLMMIFVLFSELHVYKDLAMGLVLIVMAISLAPFLQLKTLPRVARVYFFLHLGFWVILAMALAFLSWGRW